MGRMYRERRKKEQQNMRREQKMATKKGEDVLTTKHAKGREKERKCREWPQKNTISHKKRRRGPQIAQIFTD